MSKIRVAVVGYGNIGKYTVQAIMASPDIELVGIVRRNATRPGHLPENIPVVSDVKALGKVDCVVLAVPSRQVEETAAHYLKMGINTVDSFDIHTEILGLRQRLNAIAKESGSVAIISAGWDPGSDSIIRTLFEAMAPKGLTYTNFGPGMSMGHSVVARSVAGVKDALSMTMPMGSSIHKRMVYIELEDGASFETVSAAIKSDPYFSHDETHVILVDSVDALKDMGHGVLMTRKGVSGTTQNQLFSFDMRINNPALTAQILVATARASTRLKDGCYTMVEIPVVDLLPGEREEWIHKLV